ncbi:MAG: DUF2306 domain-containing protein [Bacteroidota bacterium]
MPLKTIIRVSIWVVVILLSTYFYLESVAPYFLRTIEPRKLAIEPWLITHFAGAFCTLFLGPLQFWPKLRRKYPVVHRALGKIYIVGTLLGASTVFYLLFNGYPLPGGIPSLFVLALLWIFVTSAAWICIKNRDIDNHRKFMIRSYVFGLAFVFIRVFNRLDEFGHPLFPFIKDETMRYTLYEWICWVLPLVILEMTFVWWPLLSKKSIVQNL